LLTNKFNVKHPTLQTKNFSIYPEESICGVLPFLTTEIEDFVL